MQAVLDAAWKHLLPALDAPATVDSGAETTLQQRLSTLALSTIAGSRSGPDSGPWTFAAALSSTEPGLVPDVAELTVTPKDDGWSVRFDGDQEIRCGYGAWTEGTVEVLEWQPMPVAGCAAWTEAGEFEVDIAFLDTPHTLRITCGAGTFDMAWKTAPLHGGRFADLAAPRARVLDPGRRER